MNPGWADSTVRSDSLFGLIQQMFKGGIELGETEFESAFDQPRRSYTRAGQQSLAAHFPKKEFYRGSRDGQKRRPPQGPREPSREVRVRNCSGGDRVDCAAQARVVQGPLDHVKQILQRNPTPILSAIAQPSAEPKPERRQHPGERPAVAGQHNAEPQMHHANAVRPGQIGRRFPRSADLRQKTRSRPAVLIEHFVASVTVKSCR